MLLLHLLLLQALLLLLLRLLLHHLCSGHHTHVRWHTHSEWHTHVHHPRLHTVLHGVPVGVEVGCEVSRGGLFLRHAPRVPGVALVGRPVSPSLGRRLVGGGCTVGFTALTWTPLLLTGVVTSGLTGTGLLKPAGLSSGTPGSPAPVGLGWR